MPRSTDKKTMTDQMEESDKSPMCEKCVQSTCIIDMSIEELERELLRKQERLDRPKGRVQSSTSEPIVESIISF